MKKQKTNKVKTVVYLIHFILIDIWARNGVLHIFLGGWWCFFFCVCVCGDFFIGGWCVRKNVRKNNSNGECVFFFWGGIGASFLRNDRHEMY